MDRAQMASLSDDRRLNFKRTLLLFATLTVIHFLIWIVAGSKANESLIQVLQHWDASWYLKIAREGYDNSSSAFLPLFPLILRSFALGSLEVTVWLGTLFSTLVFMQTLRIFADAEKFDPEPSLWGRYLLILSPASYIFHSVHTESLFLLLSVLAFAALQRRRLLYAALWVGLASLERHQGVFLAIGIAIGFAVEAKQGFKGFLLVGVISGAIWSLGPIFHLWEGRGLFSALSAHESTWYVAESIGTYFKTFILANPIQNTGVGSLIHQAFYFLLLATAFFLLYLKQWAAASYTLLSLLVMPLQGELVDSFRFGAVLFPVFFVLGDRLAKVSPLIRWSIIVAFGVLNLQVAWQYATMRWAY